MRSKSRCNVASCIHSSGACRQGVRRRRPRGRRGVWSGMEWTTSMMQRDDIVEAGARNVTYVCIQRSLRNLTQQQRQQQTKYVCASEYATMSQQLKETSPHPRSPRSPMHVRALRLLFHPFNLPPVSDATHRLRGTSWVAHDR